MKRIALCLVVSILATYASSANSQEVKLPKPLVEQYDYFVGDWTFDYELGGKTYHGTWTAKWSPDGSCLISHWKGDGPRGTAAGTRVQGWDVPKKQMLLVEFGTDGSWSMERYTNVSDTVDEGELTGVDAEGQPRKATVRTERTGKDAFTWTRTQDGQASVLKFRRVK